MALAFALAGCVTSTGTGAEHAIAAQPSKLVGTWGVSLNPAEARKVAIARLALSEKNSEREFEALKPTPDEVNIYDTIVSLVVAYDPRADKIKQEIDEADVVVTVTGEAVAFQHPGDQTKTAPYSIERDTGKELVLLVHDDARRADERLLVSFINEDTIAVRRSNEDKSMKLVRRR